MDKKKVIKWSIISALGIGLLTGIYFVVRGLSGSGGGSGTPPPDNTPTTGGGGSTGGGSKPKKGNDDFPLRLGSEGNRVRNLNAVLGLTPDPLFSNETLSTLKTNFGKTEVSEALYNSYKQKFAQFFKYDEF